MLTDSVRHKILVATGSRILDSAYKFEPSLTDIIHQWKRKIITQEAIRSIDGMLGADHPLRRGWSNIKSCGDPFFVRAGDVTLPARMRGRDRCDRLPGADGTDYRPL